MEGGELSEPEVGLQARDRDGEKEKNNFPFIDGKEQDVIWTEQLSVIRPQPLQSCLQTSTKCIIASVLLTNSIFIRILCLSPIHIESLSGQSPWKSFNLCVTLIM